MAFCIDNFFFFYGRGGISTRWMLNCCLEFFVYSIFFVLVLVLKLSYKQYFFVVVGCFSFFFSFSFI